MASTTKLEELPKALLQRLMRERLPDNVAMQKEVKESIAKVASVFVLYLTATAQDFAGHANRSTMQARDVIEALKELEFGDFVPEVQKVLEAHKKEQDEQKKRRSAGDTSAKKKVKEGDGEGDDSDSEGDGEGEGGAEKEGGEAKASGDGGADASSSAKPAESE